MRFESLLFLMACVAMPHDVARHKHLLFICLFFSVVVVVVFAFGFSVAAAA